MLCYEQFWVQGLYRSTLVSSDLTPRLSLVQRISLGSWLFHPFRTQLLLTNSPVPFEIAADVGLVGGLVMPLTMIVPPSVLSIGYSLLSHLLLSRYKRLLHWCVHPPDVNCEKRKWFRNEAKWENLEAFFSLRQFSFNPYVEAGTNCTGKGSEGSFDTIDDLVPRLSTWFHDCRLVFTAVYREVALFGDFLKPTWFFFLTDFLKPTNHRNFFDRILWRI
jgi:hypothetical protein